MTHASGDTAHAGRTPCRTGAAREGAVASCGPGRAFRAARPGDGRAAAAAGGGGLDAKARREEDAVTAGEAARAAGVDVQRPVPGPGGTALSAGRGACVVPVSARAFIRHVSSALTPRQTSLAPSEDAGADGAARLQGVGCELALTAGGLAPALGHLGPGTLVPLLPPGASRGADVFALAGRRLEDGVTQASGRPSPPTSLRRRREACLRVREAAHGFPPGGHGPSPPRSPLAHVISCLQGAAAVLEGLPGEASPGGAGVTAALPALVDVVRSLREWGAHAVFRHSPAPPGEWP